MPRSSLRSVDVQGSFPSDLRGLGVRGADGDRAVTVVIDEKLVIRGEVLWSDIFEGPEDFQVGGLIYHAFGICRAEVLKVYLFDRGREKRKGGMACEVSLCFYGFEGGGNWCCWVWHCWAVDCRT